jgi:hypothetical protein
MAVLSRELIMALMRLEEAAAAVGRLLPAEMDPEQQQQLVSAFGAHPLKGMRRDRWGGFWLQWLRDCAERLPCANPAGAAETRANEPIGPASWPQSFSDDVVQSAVSDAQNPDSFVAETQIRP